MSFLTNLLSKIAHNTVSFLVALFIVGGVNEVAGHYKMTGVQSSLTAIKGVLVTESNTTVLAAPSTTIVLSGTLVDATIE